MILFVQYLESGNRVSVSGNISATQEENDYEEECRIVLFVLFIGINEDYADKTSIRSLRDVDNHDSEYEPDESFTIERNDVERLSSDAENPATARKESWKFAPRTLALCNT